MKRDVYFSARIACYVGYITQAAVNTLASLLFVLFQRQYGISTMQLSSLILLNFGTQLVMDALSVRLIRRFGYRRMVVAAHVAAVLGLLALGLLPVLLPRPFIGLIAAVLLYSCGGGIIEVTISPIIHNLPGEHKESEMSLLHSFYCWGQMLVVLLSTLALRWTGDRFWYLVPIVWAVIPLGNLFVFLRVPLVDTAREEQGGGIKALFTGLFPLLMLMMMAAGASELTVSQWASFFAERGLGLSKTAGDLLGLCLFALTMGLGRIAYGVFGKRWDILPALLFTAGLCVVSYLMISLSPWPWLSLAGCVLCGGSVSLMWPGSIAYAADRFPAGGALMFGMLALCGDIGCTIGPWMAGGVASLFTGLSGLAGRFADPQQAGLKAGILIGTVFPLLMVAGALWLLLKDGKKIMNRENKHVQANQ